MLDKKKLVLLELDDAIYKSLKRSALQSCRAIGNEVALRIEHALNQAHDIPKGLVQVEKISMGRTGRVVQVQLREDIHIKLKTMASASNIFMKEFATLKLIQSLDAFEFIANPENAIPKVKPVATATPPVKPVKAAK